MPHAVDIAVDFSNLREITGGDKSVERVLFDDFLASSRECLQALRAAMQAQDQQGWRRQAHAMKGMCFNLGAMLLGRLCAGAQDGYLDPLPEKRQMLAAIEDEFVRVEAALKAQG